MTVVMSEAYGRQMDGLNRRGNPATVARRVKLMAVEIKATPTATRAELLSSRQDAL
jgi:hypothetical protein